MPSVHIDPGVTGAKRQSWREGNPRDVLKTLIDKEPSASEDEIQAECWAIIQTNTNQLLTIFEYWFANNWRSLMKPDASRVGRPSGARIGTGAAATEQQVRQTSAVLRRKIQQKIDDQVKVALLTMILPTGKQVQHSTREELIALGGWAQRVGEKLQPGQTVLDAGLSESALRALYA